MHECPAHWSQTDPWSLDIYFGALGSQHFQIIIISKEMGSWSRKHSLTLKAIQFELIFFTPFKRRGEWIAEHFLLNFIAVTKDNTFTITVNKSLKNKILSVSLL